MSDKRKIAYITGTRADYGLMRDVLFAIQIHPKLDLQIIVTGMHLSEKFGMSINEIRKDHFKIGATINAMSEGKTEENMAETFGKTVVGLSKAIFKVCPDIILLEGDRGEMLAAAIIGAHMGIAVAHVSGGDVSGSIDESIRHAITKFAHIHFPGTKSSASRIRQMGEEEWRIHMVGTPGVSMDVEALRKRAPEIMHDLGLDPGKETILVMQHPVVSEANEAGSQMLETIEAVAKVVTGEKQVVVMYPNSDAGSEDMIRVIEEYSNMYQMKLCRNMNRDDFLSLMSASSVVIGNSSSGIVEVPTLRVPVVNIGTRQKNRERADNVIDVGYNSKEILKAIEMALSNESFKLKCQKCKNPYHSKDVGKKIADVLHDVKLDKKIIDKEFVII